MSLNDLPSAGAAAALWPACPMELACPACIPPMLSGSIMCHSQFSVALSQISNHKSLVWNLSSLVLRSQSSVLIPFSFSHFSPFTSHIFYLRHANNRNEDDNMFLVTSI